MAIVTAVIVLVFGGLTLVLHDETFIKLKPTIIYGLFAATLGIGLLLGRSLHRHHVRSDVQPDADRLAALDHSLDDLFAGMAVLNEIIWRDADHRLLGRVQGLRRHSDHDCLCDAADASDQALSSRACDR